MRDDDSDSSQDSSELDRRDFLKSAAVTAASAALPGHSHARGDSTDEDPSTLSFREAPIDLDPDLRCAENYEATVVIRWGDPLFDEQPFDPDDLTAESQARRFGYNNDYLAFLPLPFGSDRSDRGLLCVNHEYVNPELMWSGITRETIREHMTESRTECSLAAHGHTVVEVRRGETGWRPVRSSEHNRRIDARDTPIRITGPAAGHERLQTKSDSTGREVVGTLGNCAGGVTPWGTVLLAEENFDDYFGGEPGDARLARNLDSLGYGKTSRYGFEKFRRRFDVEREPHEINRFGWVVEFDPRDPEWTPRKRTALGRFKHEGAQMTMNADGRVVLYSGDDETFQYLYRWVSRDEYDPTSRRANDTLLEEGTLYTAEFRDDGTVHWHPLVHGDGPLTEANGFRSQADVLIETRRAAALVGATALDRPEDAEVNPETGRLYVTLTNNTEREGTDPTAPRAPNAHGQILELVPPYGARRHSADTYEWNMFLLGGNPEVPEHDAAYHPKTSSHGWFSCPDNLTFDPDGRIWISSDQGDFQYDLEVADGICGADTRGPGRALPKRLVSVPVGAEATGPYFTPDGETLFLCVQHPGEYSTLDDPVTRWPDFDDSIPPRPSVVAIRRRDGGAIGA